MQGIPTELLLPIRPETLRAADGVRPRDGSYRRRREPTPFAKPLPWGHRSAMRTSRPDLPSGQAPFSGRQVLLGSCSLASSGIQAIAHSIAWTVPTFPLQALTSQPNRALKSNTTYPTWVPEPVKFGRVDRLRLAV